MNYIKRLEAEVAEREARLLAIQDAVVAFRAHLASAKFHDDTTIQVRDVDRRLLDLFSLSSGG